MIYYTKTKSKNAEENTMKKTKIKYERKIENTISKIKT